jgi:hypothetical protein
MKKIKIYLLLLIFFGFNCLRAQILITKSYADIDTSTLLIPITGNPIFDDALASSFKKYWKVSPYKIISTEEYLEKRKAYENKNPDDNPNMLNFFNFGKTGCSAPLSSLFDEYLPTLDDEGTFAEQTAPGDRYKRDLYATRVIDRMDYMVKGVNDVLAFTIANKLTAPEKEMHAKAGWVFNQKAYLIKDKTLIINRDAKNNSKKPLYKEEDFMENYPYDYKFVSDEEYKKILTGNSKEFVCLKPINSGLAFIFVYEPATRSTIYYTYLHILNIGFNKFKKDNVEELVKMIKFSDSQKH